MNEKKEQRRRKLRPRLESLDDMTTAWIVDALEVQFMTKKRHVQKPKGRKNWIRFQKLMVCPECNFVWQRITTGQNRYKTSCIKYKGMPTIGLERVICNRCKPEEET
tara:strand:+ start:352 stop:672 length:321 start_codon:yes stop_codon:yes gene_type:complete